MKRLACLAALALASAAVAQEKSDDWPRFRGTGGAGVSAAKGLPLTWSQTENVAWKAQLPGPGTSSPVVFGERIYLTCYSGYNVPGVRGGGQEDLRRHLVCLEAKTGKVVWDVTEKPALPEQDRIRDGHGYASSTPAVDGDFVYCFFGKSGAYAFTHEGKRAWQADVGGKTDGFGSGASPVLVGDLLVVNASVESQSLVALDKKTGKEKWRVKGVREAWNTPTVVASKRRTELVMAMHGKILGFDPADGKELWTCATNIPWYMVPSVVAHEGVVYALGGRGDGIGALAVRAGGDLDVTDTHRLWKINKGSNVSSPVYHDGHLYWMHDSQPFAYCANAKTGELAYEARVGGRFSGAYASPLMADGRLYYTSREGETVVLAAKPKYEKLATNNLNDRSLFHASPAVAGGRLLIRSDKYLYCLGK